MPQIGNIVINDGATTPVAHTFGPVGITGPLASYADRVGGISVGYPIITASLVNPSKTSRNYKARLKIVMPVLETISNSTMSGIAPAPTKAYDLTADITFIMPERSSLQNRKDILAFAKNLLANAVTTALVENNETVY
jgi:hypothetical protein